MENKYMSGRAWKIKNTNSDDHYKTCHAIDQNEKTFCGKYLDETWYYDPDSKDKITCTKCKTYEDR